VRRLSSGGSDRSHRYLSKKLIAVTIWWKPPTRQH
jgi:hypothetical protein